MNCIALTIARSSAVLCLLSFNCAPSIAQSADGKMSERVQIELRGHIVPKCTLSGMAGALNFDAARLGRQEQSAALSFIIDCNTPFIYGFHAAGGAMSLDGANSSAASDTMRLPYRVSLSIPTNDGGVLRAECDGGTADALALPLSCEVDSGHAVAINQQGEMRVSLPATDTLPFAGRYTDNLRIALSAKQ